MHSIPLRGCQEVKIILMAEARFIYWVDMFLEFFILHEREQTVSNFSLRKGRVNDVDLVYISN